MQSPAEVESHLRSLCEVAGLALRVRSKDHWQITGGPMLVNYYPFSRRGTAYIDGTTEGIRGVTPEGAVRMARKPPPIIPLESRAERKAKVRKGRRAQLLRRQPLCRWCGKPMQAHTPLTDDYATIEHVVPLARGGLDNANNRTLACLKCNRERGHNMPELETP